MSSRWLHIHAHCFARHHIHGSSMPRASELTQGAVKKEPRQHLREHQYVRDEQSMGGLGGTQKGKGVTLR